MSIALAQEGELPVKEIPNLGEAAELYFSPDGKRLIGNAKRDGDAAHMVYVTSVDGREIRRINDRGEDACSHFFPDGRRIVWTSTRDNLDVPKGNWSDPRDYPQGAELYSSNADGTDVKRLTSNRTYDAEVSVSPDGKWLLFTRQIDGRRDLSVQTELALDEAELRRRDQPPMCDANAVQRAVEIGVPEIEEVEELGEARGEVVVLPDIALQKLRVIRQAIENFRRGQREPLDLAKEGSVHGFVPCWSVFFSFLSLNPRVWLRPEYFPNGISCLAADPDNFLRLALSP
jgi:hypothetical protein